MPLGSSSILIETKQLNKQDISSVHGSGAKGLRIDFRLLRVSNGICGLR